MNPAPCPLCLSHDSRHYHQDRRRDYLQCRQCQLVFVPPHALPSRSEEKSLYDLHQNDPKDQGYRRFLSRLAEPLMQRLTAAGSGLDFGCGPSPVLASMLTEAGHPMSVYDPIYYPDTRVLRQQYDFVCCSEAIEHFHQPAQEWQRLLGLLKSDGLLAIMTKRVISAERFANWHYKNDPTHVCFFSEATFRWLATRDNLLIAFPADDVVIFTRQD